MASTFETLTAKYRESDGNCGAMVKSCLGGCTYIRSDGVDSEVSECVKFCLTAALMWRSIDVARGHRATPKASAAAKPHEVWRPRIMDGLAREDYGLPDEPAGGGCMGGKFAFLAQAADAVLNLSLAEPIFWKRSCWGSLDMASPSSITD